MGLLSDYYDATFDSTSFWEQSDGADYRPGQNIVTHGTLYSIGNGNHVYIDMGEGRPTFEVVAAVEGTELAALDGKRGTSGALVWSRGTQTATLLDVRRTPGQAGDLDAYTVQLVFFSNDSPTVPSTSILTESGDTLLTESGDPIIME